MRALVKTLRPKGMPGQGQTSRIAIRSPATPSAALPQLPRPGVPCHVRAGDRERNAAAGPRPHFRSQVVHNDGRHLPAVRPWPGQSQVADLRCISTGPEVSISFWFPGQPRDDLAAGSSYFRNLEVLRSARILPLVWQVGQYCRAVSAKETSRTVSPHTGQGCPVRA